jgi:hypothetical protein
MRKLKENFSNRSNSGGSGYICPICCRNHKSFQALRRHAYKGHGDLWSRCPICCKEFKSTLIHYIKMGDEHHRMLWALTAASGRVRIREPGTAKRIGEKYGWIFSENRGGQIVG